MKSALVELAKSNDVSKREQLLSSLVDLFVSGEASSSDENAKIFEDIFLKIVKDLSEEIRYRASSKLCKYDKTSPKIALYLAEDTIKVAAPMLQNSLALNDDMLIEVINKKTKDHRLAVCARKIISTAITDALISFKEPSVMKAVCVNDGADISDESLEIIAEAAIDDESIEKLILSRNNQRLGQLFIDAIGAKRRLNAYEKEEFINAKKNLKECKKNHNLSVAIKSLTARRGGLDAVSSLAIYLGISVKKGRDAYQTKDSHALILLCKAGDIDEDAFIDLMLCKKRDIKISEQDFEKAIKSFNNVTINTAKEYVKMLIKSSGI